MRIFAEPSSYHLLNVGDAAMLQVAAERFRALWPDARLDVTTNAPDALLERHCPGAGPVPADGVAAWFRGPGGSATRARRVRPVRPLPRFLADALLAVEARRRREPAVDAFLEGVTSADLVVVTGAGALTDAFLPHPLWMLGILALAIRRGTPAAMLGQGLGPVAEASLRRAAAAVLPRLNLISLREGRAGRPFLESVGVDPDRVAVTGDDAVELAYRNRPAPGSREGLGFNLRVAAYADIDSEAAAVWEEVERCAGSLGGEPAGIPISRHPADSDVETLRRLSPALAKEAEGLEDASAVVRRIGCCRIVVSGSYHAAVFALGQGIPAVCVAKSRYYADKFLGLAELFGEGCAVVPFDGSDARRRLRESIEVAWRTAADVEAGLLAAARGQIERGRAAYRRLAELV